MSISNSRGMVFVELPVEIAEFLIENCDSNIQMGLKMIDPTGALDLSRESLEKTVNMIEKFKIIKSASERATR